MGVTVAFIGRLGNNLFQYALGRIVAEQLGFSLTSSPGWSQRFVGSGATLIDTRHSFCSTPLTLAGLSYTTPTESYDLSVDRKWSGQVVPLASIVADRSPRHLHFNGYFQRYEYYEPYVSSIRQWLRLRTAATLPTQPDDVLLNVRRGDDYAELGWTLPISYYVGCLKHIGKWRRLFVCGTGIDRAFRRRLEEYSPVYLRGAPIAVFGLFAKFRRIILSNSTFSWWAAMLSPASEIYGPRAIPPARGYAFSGFGEVDLVLPAHRYENVDVRAFLDAEVWIERTSIDGMLSYSSNALTIRRCGRPDVQLQLTESDESFVRSISRLRTWSLRDAIAANPLANVSGLTSALVHAGIFRRRYHYLGL